MNILIKTLALFLFLIIPAISFAQARTITVAAASDLTFALKEISSGFTADTGVKVVLSFGSTGMLAKQIEQGAPFDAFFAADEKFISELGKKGRIIPDSIEQYAQGRLVLAVNKASGLKAAELKDLLSPEIKRVAIANPDHAPYGRAAMEAFKSKGIWDGIKSKLVYGENIRQTLQYIQSGNAQAGVIALSVAEADGITYTGIDASLHKPIIQAAGVVSSANETDARAFIKYVNSSKGRGIMKKYGFLLPEKKK